MKQESTRKRSPFLSIAVCLLIMMNHVFAQTNSAPQDTDPFPPHIQRLQKIGDGLIEQWKARLVEIEPRCPNVVREQVAELNAYVSKCDRPKNIPYTDDNKEKQLKTCLIPTIQSALDSADRLSKSAVCAPLPSAKNCRGVQCPPSPALLAEGERTNRLMGLLSKDASQVCPKAWMENQRKYDVSMFHQCGQKGAGDRTAIIQCQIPLAELVIKDLRVKAKAYCDVDLQP